MPLPVETPTAGAGSGPVGEGGTGRPWLVLVSVLSVQLGSGFARRLFDAIGPAGVVLMRQGGAAVVLLAVARPWRRRRTRREWRTIAAFGAVLGVMNLTFYEAVERLPLGVAVTVELLGPLGLALVLTRRRRELAWVLVAVAGVVLLSEGGTDLDPVGLGFALAAAVCWATYIVLSRATGRQSTGIDGLALAMTFAAVLVAPLGLRAGAALVEPRSLGLGAVVALLSGLVPFSLELVALRTVPARVFGVLMSLSPAAATLTGFALLDERLSAVQLVAMAMVIAASIATVRGRDDGAGGAD